MIAIPWSRPGSTTSFAYTSLERVLFQPRGETVLFGVVPWRWLSTCTKLNCNPFRGGDPMCPYGLDGAGPVCGDGAGDCRDYYTVQLLITSPAGGGGRSRIPRSRWHTRCERELAGTTDLKTQSNTCTLWYTKTMTTTNRQRASRPQGTPVSSAACACAQWCGGDKP